jgi:hypothetical protein
VGIKRASYPEYLDLQMDQQQKRDEVDESMLQIQDLEMGRQLVDERQKKPAQSRRETQR